MIYVENYYYNKAFELSEEARESILNTMYELRASYQEKMKDIQWFDPGFLDKSREAMRELNMYRETLENNGILIAFGWVGHRNEYFFPTYEDALAQEDWIFQCRD